MTSTTFDFGMPSGAPGRARRSRKTESGVVKTIAAWFNALFASRAAVQETEIATFIDHHGGVMTDDVEREISRRFGSVAGR